MDLLGVREVVVSNPYLYPLVIVLITVALAWSTLTFLEGLLRTFHKTSKRFNHRIISVVETPIIVVIIVVGIQLAAKNIIDETSRFPHFMLTVIIIILTYTLSRMGALILEYWSKRVSQSKGQEFHSEVLPLTKSVVTIILSIIAFILILQVWGVEVGALLTSLGIAGAILGFAFQQTLQNILGGISLIIDNSFKKGDLIQLEDGELGEIIEINLRSTKIKNFDSEVVIVPNSLLANKKITNFAQPTATLRIKIPVSVAYGSDIDKVKEVLHDSMRGHKEILTMPRRVARLTDFGDSGIQFMVFFYISNYQDMYEIRDQVMTQIYKDLYANGIEIPFPIRTIVPAKKNQYAPKWSVEKSASLASKDRKSRQTRKRSKK